MAAGRDTQDSHAGAWLAAVCALVVIYALSPGPLVWWIHHRNSGREPSWVPAVYAPLILACDRIKPIGRAYEAYFNWWAN